MNATLVPIDVGSRPLRDHLDVAGGEAIERIRAAAEPLSGAAVLHLTATGSTGSQAPNYLRSVLPLIADAGVEVRWRAVAGGDHEKVGEWFEQALGGAELAATDSEWAGWIEDSVRAVEAELANADVVVVHDAAALGCARAGAAEGVRFAWSRHEDASAPDAAAAARLPELLEGVEVVDVAPATDPLSPRNHELPRQLSGQVLRSLGIDLSRPFVCQTGTIDRWTDPHTAIDAFDELKGPVPELQLVIAGALPGEGGGDVRIAKEIDDYAAGRAGRARQDRLRRRRQRRAECAPARRALRAVALPAHRHRAHRLETWWKGTPVVASGGGPLAPEDGRDGFTADHPAEIAERIQQIVARPRARGRARGDGAGARTGAAPDHARGRGRAPARRVAAGYGGRVKVPLPDGTPLELATARPASTPRGRSARASRAPRSRSRWTASCATSRAARRRRADRDRHPEEPRGAGADSPRRRARARHGGARALSRARRSRSARRSRTASTTTSSSRRT